MFSILYFINIKNYFSVLIDKKNYKKLSYNVKLTDLIFVKFFKNITDFKFHYSMLDKRKYGKTKWSLDKKIMLFYNSLIYSPFYIKIIISFILFLLIFLTPFFSILLICFVIMELKFFNLKIKFLNIKS